MVTLVGNDVPVDPANCAFSLADYFLNVSRPCQIRRGVNLEVLLASSEG